MTHDRIVYRGSAVSVVAPGVAGYLGILANHAPIVASLGSGILTVFKADGSSDEWTVNLGLLEALDNSVSILAEEISAGRPE
jgi:F-type H+-transporting ATPase subunit epsilon